MILEISWKTSCFLTIVLFCLFAAGTNAQSMQKNPSFQRGVCLLITGNNSDLQEPMTRIDSTSSLLEQLGFEVTILRFSTDRTDHQALQDAITAWRQMRGMHTSTPAMIAGIGKGARLAALLLSVLDANRQPDHLLLLSPAAFDQTIPGTVIPKWTPPFNPTAKLIALLSDSDRTTLKTCGEYVKTWKGYDGQASLYMLKRSDDPRSLLDSLLNAAGAATSAMTPVSAASATPATAVPNPAAIPVAGWGAQRHAEKTALAHKEKFELIFVGNSITQNLEKPEYQKIWDHYFAPRKAFNLGYSGYRTENILWNIEHGELDGQSPKVVILEIGTNNIDEKNYPTRHTAGQLAGGIEAIAHLIRQKCPQTKLILLRPFPGCYGGPNPTSHRAILDRAGAHIAHLADNNHIFYCDVNHVFLNIDGTIRHELMPDWLHPNAAGATAWAEAMEPLLSSLIGDSSRAQMTPANTAIIPVTKLEEDSYNWWDRHREELRIKDSVDPEIVLIGNSITHFWGGVPARKDVSGQPRPSNGPIAWDSLFHDYRVLNLGFGWDRTQNALWRLDHGQLDGLHPRTVIVDIGTNNTSQTAHARMNTAAEIAEGVQTVCLRIRSKLPNTKIILMAIFPREKDPDHPRRRLIVEANRILRDFATSHQLTFLDIGPQFLLANGQMRTDVTSDFCHPTEKGYAIWADALRPLLDNTKN